MIYKSSLTKARRSQGGYALLIVVFLTALLLIGTMSISERVYTEGKREKEKEMIWRGKQYVRGVKLYYRKLGRFPNSMDDLTKPKIGSLRFMRQAYTDPMNKEDGTWRLIYVGPAGNLIGSLKPPQNPLNMPNPGGLQAGTGTSTTGFGAGTSSTSSTGGISLGNTPTAPGAPGTFGASGTAPGSIGSPTGTESGTAGQPAAGTVGGSSDPSQIPTGDTPTIVGGNIIGVGSKINEKSVIVYETATNYRLFEFVWDPSKDMGLTNGVGSPIGAPAGGTQGATPGGAFGGQGQNPSGGTSNPNPTNGTPNPGGTQQNPNPQQP